MTIKPRTWQADFLRAARARFDEPHVKNFLAAVCPGAGKTIGALLLVHDLLDAGLIEHVVVVGHTDRIRVQWVEAAATLGLQATTDIPASNDRWPRRTPVLVVTYQQVGNQAEHLRSLATRTTSTLVIFDEIHHAGDSNTWGARIQEAFHRAKFRLLLTGTAFRNDGQAIPYVRYDQRSILRPDFSLDYAAALREGYVAPVIFPTYSAEGEWARGDEVFEATHRQRLSRAQATYLLNTAIDQRSFAALMIHDANDRLNEIRQAGHADAAGLIVAKDQDHARRVATWARDITGEPTTLVISDEPDANAQLDAFRDDDDYRWIVAVRMVTEGVDIPRLRVGVYLTNVRSDLFMWQWVGRLNRVVPGLDDQTAYAYLPADPDLLAYAGEIYQQRLHILPPPRPASERVEVAGTNGDREPVGAFVPMAAEAMQGDVIGVAGATYPLPLIAWAAEMKRQRGWWNVSEVQVVEMACAFRGVTVAELMTEEGLT